MNRCQNGTATTRASNCLGTKSRVAVRQQAELCAHCHSPPVELMSEIRVNIELITRKVILSRDKAVRRR